MFGTDYEFIKALLTIKQMATGHQKANILATQPIIQHVTKPSSDNMLEWYVYWDRYCRHLRCSFIAVAGTAHLTKFCI